MWRAIGVRAKVTPVDYPTFLKQQFCPGVRKQPEREIASAFVYDYANRVWSIQHAFTLLHSDGPCTGVRDPVLDKILASGQSARTEDEYVVLMKQAGEMIREQSYAVQVFNTGPVLAARPGTVDAWPFPKIPYSLGLRNLIATGSYK
jgi:ABC-type transport system substrate-binding protein